MAISFGNVGIYNEEFSSIKSPDPLQGHIKYFGCCITTTTRPMATKLGKVVTYYKKLQPIKSDNPLNTWSRKYFKKR